MLWGAMNLTQVKSAAALGEEAMQHVERIVAFGPRPAGSEALRKSREYIIDNLRSAGFITEEESFTALTPAGNIPMTNIIATLPGRSDRTIVLATHYETKLTKQFEFVGANDGGSGTGLLLALAKRIANSTYERTIRLVFFDGEEAFFEWSALDSLYGSRHLAEKWKASGESSKIGAFLLIDMIGDSNLNIRRESHSTPWLNDMIWRTAARLGYEQYFLPISGAVEDDHIPFLQAGVPAADLIDFNYGPSNRYWHSADDTLDKLSAQSLGIVGEVLLAVVEELDEKQ
ncbi:MAG: hypothetical protein A3F68_02375 [Acidobacteria bacterium RIFCSPLOWO2_12_FULL_54_10]|nr:MAG: hypothetical protein A3F68_02375 [Acidobacteria bacterium RIFCSPLOWO2_12_FULL_54_10]